MDMISFLSDDLLLKILSSLPTKYIVSTMLLTKRWKFIPQLDFHDCSDDEDDFARFRQYVDMFMVLHKSPVLESLNFSLGCYSYTDDVETWIRITIARRVCKLEINYLCECEEGFNVPTSLYTFENLVVMKLCESIVLDVPNTVCLLSLKSLHVLRVEYRDMASLHRLLSGCSVLEEFVLDKRVNAFLAGLYVVVSTLQRLSILHRDDGEGGSAGNIVINTPSLKYLNIEDFCDYDLVWLSKYARVG